MDAACDFRRPIFVAPDLAPELEPELKPEVALGTKSVLLLFPEPTFARSSFLATHAGFAFAFALNFDDGTRSMSLILSFGKSFVRIRGVVVVVDLGGGVGGTEEDEEEDVVGESKFKREVVVVGRWT